MVKSLINISFRSKPGLPIQSPSKSTWTTTWVGSISIMGKLMSVYDSRTYNNGRRVISKSMFAHHFYFLYFYYMLRPAAACGNMLLLVLLHWDWPFFFPTFGSASPRLLFLFVLAASCGYQKYCWHDSWNRLVAIFFYFFSRCSWFAPAWFWTRVTDWLVPPRHAAACFVLRHTVDCGCCWYMGPASLRCVRMLLLLLLMMTRRANGWLTRVCSTDLQLICFSEAG